MTKSLDKLIAANEALKNEIAERIAAQERAGSIARISDENPDPVMRATTDGNVLYANDAAVKLLESMGIDVGDPLPSDWCRSIIEAAGGKTAIKKEMVCGESHFTLTLQPAIDAEYVNIYGRDVTERKETENQIVNYDDLTGLPNRALFQDRLKQVLSHARRNAKLAAVHLIDLDQRRRGVDQYPSMGLLARLWRSRGRAYDVPQHHEEAVQAVTFSVEPNR